MGHSVCVISNYMRMKEEYWKFASPKRPTALSPIAKRHVIRDCSNKITKARAVKDNLNLDYSVCTVQRVTAATPSIKRKI